MLSALQTKRRKSSATASLSSGAALASAAVLLGMGFFGFIDNVFVSCALTVLSVILCAFAIRLSLLRHSLGMARFCAELESAAYGKRTLVADSILDFEKKGRVDPAIAAMRETLLGGAAVVKMNRSRFNADRRIIFASLLATAAFWVSAALVTPVVMNKVRDIRTYFSAALSRPLPAWFLIGKPLSLDFSADTNVLGTIRVRTLSNRYTAVEGVVTIPADALPAAGLTLSVHSTRFGIERKITEAGISGTERLLPARWSLSVRYPGAPGLPGEDYPIPGDIDAWEGAEIRLSGEMTRELSGAVLSPLPLLESNINGRFFSLAARPSQSVSVQPMFVSPDGDRFLPPPFAVRLLPNQPPSLRLLFPKQDVALANYRWSVTLLLEAEDDQAVTLYRLRETVSNRNPRFARYTTVRQSSIPAKGGRLDRLSPVFTWENRELLPGETLSLEYRAADPFGAESAPVTVSILCPDFETIARKREAAQERLAEAVKTASNRAEGLKEDARQDNLSGYEKRAAELKSAVNAASEEVSKLANSAESSGDLAGMKETLERMKEVTRELGKQADLLKNLSGVLGKDQQQVEKVDMASLELKDQLRELESLLKGLERYREAANLLAAQRSLEETYRNLKDAATQADFDKALETYRDGLSKMKELGGEKTKELAEKLTELSKALQQGDLDSFSESDRLMKELRDSVNADAKSSAGEGMKKKAGMAKRAAEECYLGVLVLRDALARNTGSYFSPVNSNIDRLVETAGALRESTSAVRREVDSALEGVVLETVAGIDPGRLIRERAQENSLLIEQALSELRERRIDSARTALGRLSTGMSVLALQLLSLEHSMNDASKGGSGGGQKKKQLSMGMDSMSQMQSGVSSGIEEFLRRLASEGKLTPELEQSLRELAQMQSEISKNLRKMMGKQDGGLISGGREMADRMDELAKDLQSYQVDRKTLEKSKKLEEKLLQAKKSLKSRGETEARKAETARDYETVSPEDGDIARPVRLDPDKIDTRAVPEYYRRLLQRYQAQQESSNRPDGAN